MTGQTMLTIGLILGFVAGFLTSAIGGIWIAVRDAPPGQPRTDEPLPVRVAGAAYPPPPDPAAMRSLTAAVSALGECEHGLSRMLLCGACDVVSDLDDTDGVRPYSRD